MLYWRMYASLSLNELNKKEDNVIPFQKMLEKIVNWVYLLNIYSTLRQYLNVFSVLLNDTTAHNNDQKVLFHNLYKTFRYNVRRDNFVYAPSQWETTLKCNVVSDWLDAYTKWSLRRSCRWYALLWGKLATCKQLWTKSWTNIRMYDLFHYTSPYLVRMTSTHQLYYLLLVNSETRPRFDIR